MAVTIAKERWTSKVAEVVIGAEPSTVKLGGETTLPFLQFEGDIPNRPKVALEVFDQAPEDWTDVLTTPYADVLSDPVAWAKKNVALGADLVALRLVSAHPDTGDASPAAVAETCRKVGAAVDAPLVIIGCGVEEKDAEILQAAAEALAGKNCLIGSATTNNYKTITAAAMVHGHNVIASSPLDINLAKQLNILITEMNLAASRIVIDPLIGALGYGIEYAYSIMERARMGALMGDKMLAMPVVCFVGQEAWKSKEAKSPTSESPQWGDQAKRAVLWEVITSVALAQAGGDLFVMRHPESLKQFNAHLDVMMKAVTY
ncbi:MAG: acetyl-CoA decarbonylase/synthase complex subunit delta [Peptococcaceae bacterium]|jgi:acetyl-CoA decarbonylase/synthase complex subunit delta|nr:acetyl-CoA decarbonylase/synthase complex subunit delta [Peptococcaceae bacterium]